MEPIQTTEVIMSNVDEEMVLAHFPNIRVADIQAGQTILARG
jgi:hypothetical protein